MIISTVFLFISLQVLYGKINDPSAQQRKCNRERPIQRKPFRTQYNFHRAEISNLCSGAGNHERCRAAHAHAIHQPRLEQRDGPAAAGIEGDADSRRHQNAKAPVISKQVRHQLCRYIPLEQDGQHYAQQKHRASGPDISPQVFQKPQEDIGCRCPGCEAPKSRQS